MGIQYLQSFVKNECGARTVNIRDLAKEKLNQGLSPTIIVDLFNIGYSLYGNLDWVNGGQFKEYRERVAEFIQAFKSAGIKLIFVCDGTVQLDKKEEWIKRRYRDMKEKVFLNYDALKRGSKPPREGLTPMVMTKHLLHYEFEQMVKTSLIEGDDLVAALAKEHNAIGILADDSDFLVYQTNGIPLLSGRDLDWDTLRTTLYDPIKLAERLKLSLSQLPILGLLAGNDKTKNHPSLGEFINIITRGNGFQKFQAIGAYINEHRLCGENDLGRIATDVFQDPGILPVLRRSYRDYCLRFGVEDTEEGAAQDTSSGDSDEYSDEESEAVHNWNKILRLFKEDYQKSKVPDLYPIMIGEHYKSACFFEDFRSSIPTTTKLWASSRRRAYGILLKEKPRDNMNKRVEEICMSGPESLDEEVFVVPDIPDDHPGLLYLHSQDTRANSQDIRWKLFAWCVHPKIDPRILMNLKSGGEVCLVSNLFKMQNEFEQPILEDIEAIVFILQFYVLQTKSSKDLASLDCLPTARGAQLAVLYTRTFLFSVNGLVGQVVPMAECLNQHHFDGKLFQTIYNSAMTSADCTLRELVTKFAPLDQRAQVMKDVEKILRAVERMADQ